MKKYFCDVCGERVSDLGSAMMVQGPNGMRLTVDVRPSGWKKFSGHNPIHLCRRCIARAFWPEIAGVLEDIADLARHGEDKDASAWKLSYVLGEIYQLAVVG